MSQPDQDRGYPDLPDDEKLFTPEQALASANNAELDQAAQASLDFAWLQAAYYLKLVNEGVPEGYAFQLTLSRQNIILQAEYGR